MFALLALMIASCAAPAASPTQQAAAPAATQEPAAELPAATEAPAATEPPPAGESPATSLPQPASPPAALSPTAQATLAPAGASDYAGTATALFSQQPVEEATLVPTTMPASATQEAVKPAQPTQPQPVQPSEDHTVQVEWPAEMRLGDSDIVRLTLVPSSVGFTLVTEYPEHQTVTQTVTVNRQAGYDLFAVARLDGPGFEITPPGDQTQFLAQNQPVSWRWSLTPRHAGRQRAALSLNLRWLPQAGSSAAPRSVTIYSTGLEVQVHSFLGMTRSQAFAAAVASLIFGGSLGLTALVLRPAPATRVRLHRLAPNSSVIIEQPAGLDLPPTVLTLLQTLFNRYQRLVVEQEFLSGYSGARTLLVLPVRADGRADAYTIAKIGQRSAIQQEFENYETFVKDTLPPITARIQRPPVASKSPAGGRLAALQYTFIGQPGKAPVSLRQELLLRPDPAWLRRLMETFGPNWWYQRRPYTFRLALEYDRLLPTHLIVEPARGQGRPLDGRLPPAQVDLRAGDTVQLYHFPNVEFRSDGRSSSLQGIAQPGQPPLRVRWLSAERPEGMTGRVVATRADILQRAVAGFDLYGLPDPLEKLIPLLKETITGSQSTIHGDLNLENILIGPGGMLWLIDFAGTRDGHTLLDFAHIAAQLIAHILAARIGSPGDFVDFLEAPFRSPYRELNGLLQTTEELAQSCLFNPSDLSEYHRVLGLTCLGALKHVNLSTHTRSCLYLAAAYTLRDIGRRVTGMGNVPGGADPASSASASASI